MSHLTIEALVSLRDTGSEPGTAAAREHLEHCGTCQLEFERLHQRVARLKALPPLRPGRDRWPETVARFRAERSRRRIRWVGLAGLAAAASVALALGIGNRPPAPDLTISQLNEAMVRSQALESALSAYNPDGRVLDGRTARMAEELEEQIARVDRALEATELLQQQARDQELLQLWRERVGLLDALVDVHLTRASNAGL